MKTRISMIFLAGLFSVSFLSCHSSSKKTTDKVTTDVAPTTDVVIDGFRFCESTYPYDGGLLVANFGTDELNPLNQEGKGYIMYSKGEVLKTLIPADGNLNAPKGMYEKDGHLFICDVNKIVVYNLHKPDVAPQTIRFPENNLFVNDLAAAGETLYASVTNTGKIFSIDISNLSLLDEVVPEAWCEVIGANGIVVDDNSMYVASYPADGNTTDDNVIYHITNLSAPQPEKFITEAGQYDGIALSKDKKILYVTSWAPAGVFSIDMTIRQLSPIELQTPVVGAADMSLINGALYIPDLPNSRVIVHTL